MTEVSGATIAGVIIGMALINFAIRFGPLAALTRVQMPRPFKRWLSFIPISVMGALVANEVLRPSGTWHPPLQNPGVWAALLTMVVFKFTRSFLGATVAGMASFVALRALIG